MDNQDKPSRESLDGLALARQHVRALTDGGVSRQALLRALLEQEEASNELPALPSLPSQSSPQAKPKSNPISRTLSLSQAKSKKSHWSISTSRRSPRHPVLPLLPQSRLVSSGVLPWKQRLNSPHRSPARGGGSTSQFRSAVDVDHKFGVEKQLFIYRDVTVVSVKYDHAVPRYRASRQQAYFGKYQGLLVHIVSLTRPLCLFASGIPLQQQARGRGSGVPNPTLLTIDLGVTPSSNGSLTGRDTRMSSTSVTRSTRVPTAIASFGVPTPSINITRHVITAKHAHMPTR